MRLLPIFFACLVFISSSLHAAERPNVLIIMADDCTYTELPFYGGLNAKTPNLDRFASQGMIFNRAYLSSAMCQPCRAELFTGRYPLNNGCAWNHSACRDEIRSLPHLLKPLGYRVGIAGKIHVKPESVFPFEEVPGFDANAVRNPTRPHDTNGIAEFIARNPQEPFCLVVALVEPHVPWVMGDASQYPPEKIRLPPNIADTQRTRNDFGKYLAEITYMDGQVGEILETLEQAKATDDTLVLFTSEQGAQFPGCKWTNWDTGLHTALVARWPGHVPENQRTDALVQYADIAPTLFEIARGTAKKTDFDGTSFLSVLRGESSSHRDYVYGVHNNIPEGPAYPIRTISDGEFRYIRNLTPDEIYIEKHLMGTRGTGELNNPYWGTWIFESAHDPEIYRLVKRYTRRPAEEFYHTARDPFEFENRIDDPAFSMRREELKQELDRWLKSQGDPGIPQDTQKAYRAAIQGDHLFRPPNTP